MNNNVIFINAQNRTTNLLVQYIQLEKTYGEFSYIYIEFLGIEKVYS